MIETAFPAAYDQRRAQNANRIPIAPPWNTLCDDFMPAAVRQAYAQWKCRRAAEATKRRSQAVFDRLDAHALYDVGATDIVNSGPRHFWK